MLSDTHSFLHEKVFDFFRDCHEVWHAGDIGDSETAGRLHDFKPLRAVYGNIDGGLLRQEYREHLLFYCEQVKVFMIHIGGSPGRYNPGARQIILREKPGLVIAGHSHILMVKYDHKYGHLYINPGAAGKSGFHRNITFLKFIIDGDQIRDLLVMDIPGERG